MTGSSGVTAPLTPPSTEIDWEVLHQRDPGGHEWVLHRALVDSPQDDGPLDLRIEQDEAPEVYWEIIRYDVGDIRRGGARSVNEAKRQIAAVLPGVWMEIEEEAS